MQWTQNCHCTSIRIGMIHTHTLSNRVCREMYPELYRDHKKPKHSARKSLQSFHTWHSAIYSSGKTSLVYWEKEENTSSAWWPICKNPLPPPATCYLISNLVFSFPWFKVIHRFLLMFTGGGGDKHLAHVFSKVLYSWSTVQCPLVGLTKALISGEGDPLL